MTGARHTIVVPVFNEDQNLRLLHRRLAETLTPALAPQNDAWEVLFVNDGSYDGTEALLRELQTDDPEHVRVVSFSRNFGHEAALAAGLDHAAGETVVFMDADLQDPPEVVPEMIAKWRAGYEVVYGRRSARERETWFKKATAAAFYRLLRWASDTDVPMDAGDFRLLSRRAAKALAALREQHRLVRGMSRWIGFKQTAVEFVRPPRRAGETKYSPLRMTRLAWDGLTSFSLAPLRAASLGGIAAIVGALALGVWALAARLIAGPPLHRTASLIAALVFMGGVQLLALGVLGEYVGRTFHEVKRRPLYVVDYTLGLREGERPPSA